MKKNWKTTVLGIIGGSALAISTGNCSTLVGMIPADKQQAVGAVAGTAVALMGMLAKDASNKDEEKK